MFPGCTVPPDSKEIKLVNSSREASPSAGKNTGIKLVSCCAWSVPLQLLPLVSIFLRSLGVTWWQISSQWGSPKLLRRLVSHELKVYLSVFNPLWTQWIMEILSKGCKPDNFESHSSLKLSFTNIWGLRSNFVECDSFLESISPDILAPAMWDYIGWLNWFW